MPEFICITCGTQFPASETAPHNCPICDDERQYVPPTGQQWTTLDNPARTHRNSIRQLEAGLLGIGTEPAFAIGQRALLVKTAAGNVLWDCVALLDDATIEVIGALGGIEAIAISHPHYYTTMVEWAWAFGAPVYIHAADREWVMRPDRALQFWDDETLDIPGGLTLVRCGGHFEGSAVLHWPEGAGGRGALLTGDTLQVLPDLEHVSFMRSYPNLIPLGAPAIEKIARAIEPLKYDRIYGAWWDRHIESDAKNAVARSADRYLAAISADRAMDS
jgi:hypothetical protein